jgi:hypothetical protein
MLDPEVRHRLNKIFSQVPKYREKEVLRLKKHQPFYLQDLEYVLKEPMKSRLRRYHHHNKPVKRPKRPDYSFLKSGWNSNPWFSDFLSGCLKWFLR